MKHLSIASGLLMLLAQLLFPGISNAQSEEKVGDNEMKIKIVTNIDGEETVNEQTIDLNSLNELDFERMMEELHLQMEQLQGELKDMDIDIQLDLNDMEGLQLELEQLMAEDMPHCHKMMAIHDNAPAAFLGVYTKETSDEQPNGVLVDGLVEGAAAEAAGLQKDDIITSVNGLEVNTTKALLDALAKTEPGDGVKINYIRNEGMVNTTATLSDRADFQTEEHVFVIDEDMQMSDNVNVEVINEGGKVTIITTGEDGTVEEKVIEIGDEASWVSDGESPEKVVIIEEDEDMPEGKKVVTKVVVVKVEMQDLTAAEEEDMSSAKGWADSDIALEVEQLNVFPNPNQGQFKLSFSLPEPGKTNIALYTIDGKRVYDETLKNFDGQYDGTIALDDATTGTYVLQISQGDKVLSKKIAIE